MSEFLTVLMIVAIPAATIGLGVHFGSKWIDRMLCVRPPIDPNKPIVRDW